METILPSTEEQPGLLTETELDAVSGGLLALALLGCGGSTKGGTTDTGSSNESKTGGADPPNYPYPPPR